MPPTGGASSNRRGAHLPPGEGQFALMRYMGMAAAGICAVAGGFNLYEKHKDQFISGPPHNMPRRIERQILAGSTEEDEDDYTPTRAIASSRRNATSSTVTAGGDFSTGHLRSLQDEYKEELIESNDRGDYKRATDVSQTLEMIQQVLDMRDEVSRASQVGDMQTISSMSSKLGKTQRALEQRLNEVDLQVGHDESRKMEFARTNTKETEISSSVDSSDDDDDLSKDELVVLRAQLEDKMKTIDTKTREGMAEWRGCYKRIKALNEALDLLEAIDIAEEDDDNEDDEELKGPRERLSLLQRELSNKATTPPSTLHVSQGFLGLFRGSQVSASTSSKKMKKRPAPKIKSSPPRKKVASGASKGSRTTSSGRTTHPPAAFVAGPASRKGNDDTIAGLRAAAEAEAEAPSTLSNDQSKIPPSPLTNTTRSGTTIRCSSSDSSSVTSQNTKAKESSRAPPQPDFVKSCPEYGPGWIVKGYERKSGTSKGQFDKYWYSPCGKKHRSRKEVERFLKESVANIEGQATNTSTRASNSTETDVIKYILGRKFNPASERTEYLIHWEGYPDPIDFTFEPVESLGHRHVDEPDERWDTDANPEERIEVNDIQRDSKDVHLYAKLMNLETDIPSIEGDNNGSEEGGDFEEEEDTADEETPVAAQQDSNDLKEDSPNEVATNGDHETSTAPAAIGVTNSFESDSLPDKIHQNPNDEEGQRDDASTSSETTYDGAGSLL